MLYKYNPQITIGQFSKSDRKSKLNILKQWLRDGFILKIYKDQKQIIKNLYVLKNKYF
jgi:hypothetical protein